mgnify:CR=1 FL=1
MAEFKKYSSIDNPYQVVEKFKQYGHGNQEWLGFEKVHGSNYQFTWDIDPDESDSTVVKVGKRTSILEQDEKFMNHQRVRDRYIDNVKKLFEFIRENSDEPLKKIVLFGEFYGGTGYGETKAHPESGHPQKNIMYCCDNDFVGFDMYIQNASSEHKGTWAPPLDLISLCEQFSIPVLRPLHRGTLDTLMKLSPEFVTTIPTIFHNLEPIEGNLAEGFVLKPVIPSYMPNGSRVIVKYKSVLFSEEKPHKIKIKKESLPIEIPDEVRGLMEEAGRFITQARLDNVKTKLNDGDKHNLNKVNGLLVGDAYDDFSKTNTVDKKQKKFITGHLMQLAQEINK